MEFNIAGIIVKQKFDNEKELESLLKNKLTYSKDVGFDEATSSNRDESTIDVLQSQHGVILLMGLEKVYDLANAQSEIIQFMISDVSDTYYFEKYSGGRLDRKYISSQGDVVEDYGEDPIDEDDLVSQIWEFTDEYLGMDFTENMFDLKFKRYAIV